MPALFFLMVVVGGAFWWFENPDLQEQAKRVAAVATACALAYWAYRKARAKLRLAQHGRLLERLRSFAAGLTHGELAGAGFFQGGTARVTGTFEGLRLQLDASFGDDACVTYELTGVDGLESFDAAPAPLLVRLISDQAVRYQVPIVERRGGPELALRRLFGELGIRRVHMSHGILRATGPASEEVLSPDLLFTVFRELGRIARVYKAPSRRSGPAASPSGRASRRFA